MKSALQGKHPFSISHPFFSAKTTVALNLGMPYNHWEQGVTVMLEKEFKVNLMNKLQAMLLIETDFNAKNKLIFCNKMLHVI